MYLFPPPPQRPPLDEPDKAASSPKEHAIVRLIAAIVLERNYGWAVQRARYMTLETIAPLSDDPTMRLSGNRRP
jgi:hypothetical protein